MPLRTKKFAACPERNPDRATQPSANTFLRHPRAKCSSGSRVKLFPPLRRPGMVRKRRIHRSTHLLQTRQKHGNRIDSLPISFVRLPIALLFGVGMLAATAFAQPQTRGSDAPENSSPRPYGSGWTCDSGFREVQGKCDAIRLPENAHLTGAAYGTGWDCNHGFERSGDSCLKVVVPPNAYLESSGTRWSCERGFVRAGDTCTPIAVPANGYLTNSNYGTGWACERGFRPDRGACARIVLPANSYLTDSSAGPGWACERGFAPTGESCTKIVLPENAHLNSSGDGWQCNRPYRQFGGKCQAP